MDLLVIFLVDNSVIFYNLWYIGIFELSFIFKEVKKVDTLMMSLI